MSDMSYAEELLLLTSSLRRHLQRGAQAGARVAGDNRNESKAPPGESAGPIAGSSVELFSPGAPSLLASNLEELRAAIGDCQRCKLCSGRTHLVFGVGDPHAKLMFVGEGPGADEDMQGEPFVGRAGQLLNNMIKAMGLKREEVYIANIVKCRPPGNRTPERDECDTCSPFLMRQIAVIKPKVVVALGAVAAKNLLAINAPMSELRGRFYDFMPAGAQ